MSNSTRRTHKFVTHPSARPTPLSERTPPLLDAGFVAVARLLSSSADSAAAAGSSPDQAFSNVESRDRCPGFLGLPFKLKGVVGWVRAKIIGREKRDGQGRT